MDPYCFFFFPIYSWQGHRYEKTRGKVWKIESATKGKKMDCSAFQKYYANIYIFVMEVAA